MKLNFEIDNDGCLELVLTNAENYDVVCIASDSYNNCFEILIYNPYFHLSLMEIGVWLQIYPWLLFNYHTNFMFEIRFLNFSFFTYLKWSLIREHLSTQISKAHRNGETRKAFRLSHLSQIMWDLEQAFNHAKALLLEK